MRDNSTLMKGTGAVNLPLHSGKKEKKVYSSILDGIPDEPRIPLRNYLLDLVTEDDRKESSLYINGVHPFIRETWNEIIRNNWRKLDVRSLIPERLDIEPTTLYAYKNSRKAISIQKLYELLLLWQEYCKNSERDVKEKWDSIFNSNVILSTHSKHQKTTLPRYLTPKLSYLLGWICGDGHLKECHNYVIKISEKSTRQLKFVLKPLFRDLFNVNASLFQRYKGGYAIQIGSKPIFRFLTQVMRIRVGEIPEIAWKIDKVNKKFFLMGLFDSEGSVACSYPNSKVVITQSNREFLEEVIKLFGDIDIHFTGPYLNKSKLGNSYFIQVRKKSELLKFNKLIGSCHVDKTQKLQRLVDKIETYGNS